MISWKKRTRAYLVGSAVSLMGASVGIAGEVASPPPAASNTAATTVTPTAGRAPAAAPASTELSVQLVRERYDDRSIKLERHVAQDASFNFVNHGSWTMWDQTGNLVAKGDYIQGRRQGEWIRYYASGDVKESLDKEGGAQVAPVDQTIDPLAGTEFEGFRPPIASKAKFVDDRIVGTWSVADSEGRPLFAVDLTKDVPHGKATWYYANGKKHREIDFKNGVVDGLWQEWSESGSVSREDRYIEGCRLAEVTLTNDAGAKNAEGVYLYAKDNVRVELDWWSGLMEVEAASTDGKAMKQGKWLFYHDDGTKRYEAEYLDDKPIGLHVWWYTNGQKECEGRYENGHPVGAWVYWHENGLQAAQGEYVAGNKSGRWMRWNEDGKVIENTAYGNRGQSYTKATAPIQGPGQGQPVARPNRMVPPPQTMRRTTQLVPTPAPPSPGKTAEVSTTNVSQTSGTAASNCATCNATQPAQTTKR